MATKLLTSSLALMKLNSNYYRAIAMVIPPLPYPGNAASPTGLSKNQSALCEGINNLLAAAGSQDTCPPLPYPGNAASNTRLSKNQVALRLSLIAALRIHTAEGAEKSLLNTIYIWSNTTMTGKEHKRTLESVRPR